MGKKYTQLILFILFIMFGIIIGIQFHSAVETEEDILFPYSNDFKIQEVIDLRKANEDIKNKIKQLKLQVEKYEEEKAAGNIALQMLKAEVNEHRFLAGYTPAKGPGIIITIEGSFEENIAVLVDQRKYLVNLVNELKIFGGEIISVNNHRITSRSEITLAGNHINVNLTPIAPPYIIRVIGDVNRLKNYVETKTVIFELMAGDGIKSDIKFEPEINIPVPVRVKSIRFFTPTEIAEE